MGALFNFPAGSDADLPFARKALARCQAERAGLKNEVAKLVAMRRDLEPKLSVIGQAEHEVDALLNRDAQSLIDRMRSGVEAALDLFGGRARIVDERLAASKHQAEVARRAIVAIDVELEHLALVDAELAERQKFLVADAVRESAAGLYADFSTAADQLRDGLVRLTALSRHLAPETAEFVPGARRIAVPIPDFVGGDGMTETVVVASAPEIERVEAIIRRYAEALALDARTPFPTLPEVDASPDGAIYSDLSGPERSQIDRDFVPPVNTHRQTVDSELFREQAASKFAAITN